MGCRSLTAFLLRKPPTANWNLHASGLGALVFLGLLASSSPVQAQFQYEQPGSKYYVWGQVASPGAYSFVASPDLLELLSAGGGPTKDANLKRVLLIRAVTKKRTRIDLQAMLVTGQVVRLSPGDVVIVPSTPWYYMRDVLSILTTAAGFVTLYFTIVTWAGKP